MRMQGGGSVKSETIAGSSCQDRAPGSIQVEDPDLQCLAGPTLPKPFPASQERQLYVVLPEQRMIFRAPNTKDARGGKNARNTSHFLRRLNFSHITARTTAAGASIAVRGSPKATLPTGGARHRGRREKEAEALRHRCNQLYLRASKPPRILLKQYCDTQVVEWAQARRWSGAPTSARTGSQSRAPWPG